MHGPLPDAVPNGWDRCGYPLIYAREGLCPFPPGLVKGFKEENIYEAGKMDLGLKQKTIIVTGGASLFRESKKI